MRISDWSSDVCSSDLFPGYTNVKSYGAAGTVVQNIGSLSLTSITAWRKLRSLQSIDSDQSCVAFIQGRYHVDFEKRSDELRVGNECVSTCRSRWSPCHLYKTKDHNRI